VAEEEHQKQVLAQQEKARTDSPRRAQEATGPAAKAGEDVRRQQEAQQKEKGTAGTRRGRARKAALQQRRKKTRRDSVEAAGRQRDQQTRLDAERKRQLEAQQAKARQDSPRREECAACSGKDRRRAAFPGAGKPRQPGAPVAKKPEPEPEVSKSAQQYLAGIRENRKKRAEPGHGIVRHARPQAGGRGS